LRNVLDLAGHKSLIHCCGIDSSHRPSEWQQRRRQDRDADAQLGASLGGQRYIDGIGGPDGLSALFGGRPGRQRGEIEDEPTYP